MSFIAVSKLCCPVCHELLNILRGETKSMTKALDTRGNHPRLYLVDLPPWLPKEIVEKMVKRFQQYLVTELLKLVKRAKGHARSPSGQSFNSDSSGSNDGIVFLDNEV
jgi:hypothetical protein